MSKNLTRKGLALGAIVALGSSLLAGAPAFAASLSVVPDSGTGTTVLASDSFKIRTLGVDYSLTSSSVLNYKITKPSSTASVAYTLSNHDTSYGSNTPASFSTTTVDYIKSGATATVGARPSLVINPSITSSGASEDYVVQAFIESGAADGLDAGDTVVSPAVTIHFVKSLASTVTLDQVAIGQNVTGTVKFDNADFNYGQSTLANTGIRLKEGANAFNATQPVTREADNKNFEFSVAYSSVDAGDVIAAKSEVIGYDSDSTLSYSPVVYSTAPSASTAAAVDTTITAGENIKVGAATSHVIRTGTKTFTYRVDFYKEAGKVNLVAAGQPVVLTATEMGSNTVDTTDVIRINGKKITGTNGSSDTATLNTVTDAKGGVDVTITSDLASALDKIRVTATAAGTAIVSDNDFVWNDAALTTFNKVDAPLVTNSVSVVRGSVISQKYALRDQFGKLFTSSTYSYRLHATKSGGTLVLDTTVDFVGGEATLTFTDNSSSATLATSVTATLQQKTTGDYSDYTTGTLTSSTAVTRLNIVATAQSAVKITPTTAYTGASYNSTQASSADGVATNTAARSGVTLKALDLRSNLNGASLGIANGKGVKLAGSAYNADGSAAAGVAVTVSATGLFFSTTYAGDSYVSADKITVLTETDGSYAVYAHSNKGGAAAITIASGSATKIQNVKFAAADATDGSAIAITAPDSSLAGRSVDVSVLLTDKYGAPVKTTGQTTATFKIAVTGPGSYTTITNDTDADGLSAFKLIFGANDNGTAVVKVTYDADGDATVYSPVVVTKSILVGTAAVSSSSAAVAGSTGKFYVSVSNAAAKKVVIKVAGKFVKSFTGTAAKKTVVTKSTKGSKKVTVYVGGKLAATKTVTVK